MPDPDTATGACDLNDSKQTGSGVFKPSPVRSIHSVPLFRPQASHDVAPLLQ